MTSSQGNVASATAANLPPIVLPIHSLARYIRTRIDVADGVLRWRMARTLLKIIPLGTRQVDIPLSEVGFVRLVNPGNRVRVVVGLACLVAPFFVVAWWAAIPIAIVLTWVMSVMLGPRLEVATRSGRRHRANVCFSHQLDAELFIEAVSDLARRP